ncbi:MAG: hypothetical protein ACREA0_00915, partial [bacterium]
AHDGDERLHKNASREGPSASPQRAEREYRRAGRDKQAWDTMGLPGAGRGAQPSPDGEEPPSRGGYGRRNLARS